MDSLIPSHSGLLPWWLLILGVTSIGNSVQAYTSLATTQRIYAGPPPSSTSSSTKTTKTTTTVSEQSHNSPATPLSARTFGTWTLAVAVARIYAAYHVDERAWYHMGMWTFGIAAFHFMTEAFVYKTARPSGPWLAPATISVTTLTWMFIQQSWYLK